MYLEYFSSKLMYTGGHTAYIAYASEYANLKFYNTDHSPRNVHF